MRHLLLMLVFLPLAVPGSLLHVPLGLLIGWAGQHLAPRKDVIATTKLLLSLLIMLASFLLSIGTVGLLLGAQAALAVAVLLPLSGYATLRVLERNAALRRIFRTLVGLIFFRQEIEELRAEREALEAAVVQAVERFRPKDMVPLFPHGGGA